VLAPVEGTGSVAIAQYKGHRPGAVDDSSDLPTKARMTLDALTAIALPNGVATGAWKERAIEEGVGRSVFYDHLKRLVTTGLVRNVGTTERPRYVPSDQEEQ
jgi:transposase